MDTRELIEDVEEIMRLVGNENVDAHFKLTLLRAKLKMEVKKEPEIPEGAQYTNGQGQYFKRELLGPKRNKVWWAVWSPTAQQWLTLCGEPSNVDKLVKL